MCGICGEITLGGGPAPEERVAGAMAAALTHRGPDDGGLHLDEHVALASRRLSIIDLAGGHQPIYNEDRSLCVVFNGEIYNQRALRTELERSGHQFATDTDTEVLVHLQEEHGEAACQRLNGMFAYALWNSRSGQALIVRDRLGIKPLYYFQDPERLIFGSEIKAILAHPAVAAELNPEGLDLYLALRYLPQTHTLFRGIRKLEPGCMLRVDTRSGKVETPRYWNPAEIAGTEYRANPAEMASHVEELLTDAVRARLMSDVPFGAFLSGGLDSSGVVALMSRELGEGVNTFSIGFSEDQRLDERSYARLVAQQWHTRHREVDCTASTVENLPRLIHHFDEPFADPIIVPTYQVSQLAAQHVKVVLTGEGADEIFGGYSRFVSDQHMRRLHGVPHLALRLLQAAAGLLPSAGLRSQSQRGLRMAQMEDGERFLEWVLAFGEEERRQLYTDSMRGHAGPAARQLYSACAAQAEGLDATNRMLYCDMMLRLPECMLARTDRMTMAVSLEGRTPFLDHRLVEFMLRLPGALKVNGGQEKVLLKRVLQSVLPAAVVQRRKQGLAVPFAQWTRYGIEAHIRRILNPERVASRGLFQPRYVQDLLAHWGDHAARHSQLIWSLLCLELWCRIYLDGDLAPDTPLSEVA
jgi:asparagine synthase (glutamine-hydrolysing)